MKKDREERGRMSGENNFFFNQVKSLLSSFNKILWFIRLSKHVS